MKKEQILVIKVRRKTFAEDCHRQNISTVDRVLYGNVSSKVQRNRQLRTYRSNKKPTFRGTPHRYRKSRRKVRAPP